MKKANIDIRQKAKEAGVCLWQIGDQLGVCDTTMSKMLRRELLPEKKKEFMAIINKINSESA
jgi:hypothetical protein